MYKIKKKIKLTRYLIPECGRNEFLIQPVAFECDGVVSHKCLNCRMVKFNEYVKREEKYGRNKTR